jgi:hypothetical protein
MEEYIIGVIEDILNGVTSMGGESGLLVQTPAQFNSSIYSWVSEICQTVAMPVAYVVLALIFTLELYNASTRIDGAGAGATFGAEMIVKIMIKFVLCKLAVDVTPQILGAIFELSSNIIGNISGLSDSASTEADLDTLRAAVADLSGMFTKLFLGVQVTIIWVVFKFSSLCITLVVIGRMVEIYIYTAIAAIPIATLGAGEFSMIGKNFLKAFAAVCVQGVIIYLAMSMFGTLATTMPSGNLAEGDITGALFQCLLYSLVLVMAVFSSGRIAKSICNAM